MGTNVDELLAAAQSRLHGKLAKLDLAATGISAYNQRYLGAKLTNIAAQLQLDAYLLKLCLARWPGSLSEFTLVDYGAGSGVLSFLAKELGIGTVIYNDIYDVSCADAQQLSQILELPLDHVVCGDLDGVLSYLNQIAQSVNAFGSYDVLEHIYDVKRHFQQLGSTSAAGAYFRIVYASGANIKNPRYVRNVSRVQRLEEYTDRQPEWGHKERDTLRAFVEIRKDLVRDYAPELTTDTVDYIAEATRGLRVDDIQKCVDEYRQSGSISYRPDHPTNTCDPYTGNWSEHLMEPRWLEGIVREAGFSVSTLSGQYTPGGSLPKRTIQRTLNLVIRLLGDRALAIAPFYVVYGKKA